MNDLRFALRQLRKAPGFTILAVLTLANIAIFRVVNGVMAYAIAQGRQEMGIRRGTTRLW